MLSAEEQEIVEAAVVYAYRIGRNESGRSDRAPDGLWPMMLGTFPELAALVPEHVQPPREGSGSS